MDVCLRLTLCINHIILSQCTIQGGTVFFLNSWWPLRSSDNIPELMALNSRGQGLRKLDSSIVIWSGYNRLKYMVVSLWLSLFVVSLTGCLRLADTIRSFTFLLSVSLSMSQSMLKSPIMMKVSDMKNIWVLLFGMELGKWWWVWVC